MRSTGSFQQIVDQWEQLGNEAAQWWVLLNLAVLLARIHADRDAAHLAGAVLATGDRHPNIAPYMERLQQAHVHSRRRLGTRTTAAALAEGATLTHRAAVATHGGRSAQPWGDETASRLRVLSRPRCGKRVREDFVEG